MKLSRTAPLRRAIRGLADKLANGQGVAEDAEEAWVECRRCGRETERCEDAYADFNTAEWLWQEGKASIPKWRQTPVGK